jgi:CubicO group peptidase (beta-lactamase class C family)
VHGAVGAMLDRYLTSPRIFKEPFSGVALVALRGEVLLEKGYGTADAGRKLAMPADSIWDWASVTKQFTAAAVLKLEMQGKLSLDDSIRRFYPEAPTARRSSTTAAASGTSSRSTSGT